MIWRNNEKCFISLKKKVNKILKTNYLVYSLSVFIIEETIANKTMIKVLPKLSLTFIIILFLFQNLFAQSVNPVNGQLGYSVPVMEVPGPTGSFPIIFNYSAGIKPSQESSWIGLGWDFHPGAIKRVVNLLPDDFNGNVDKSASFIQFNEAYEQANKEALKRYYTMNADRFIYTMGNNGFEGVRRPNTPDPPDSIDINQNEFFYNHNFGSLYLNEFYTNAVDQAGQLKNLIPTPSNYSGYFTDAYALDAQTIKLRDPNKLDIDKDELPGGIMPAYDNFISTVPSIAGQFQPSIIGEVGLMTKDDPADDLSETIPNDYKLKFRDHSDQSAVLQQINKINFRYNNSAANNIKYHFDENDPWNNVNNTFEFDPDHTDLVNGRLQDNKLIKWFTNKELDDIEKGVISNNNKLMIHPLMYEAKECLCPTNLDSRRTLCFNTEDYWNFHYDWDIPSSSEKLSPEDIEQRELGGYFNNGTVKIFSVSDQIGAFLITDDNGFNYHFSLPIYQYNTVTVNRSSTTGDISESYNELRNPYAYEWELYAITGPDFVDINSNHIPDEGDQGYWIRFDYGLWSRDYKFRSPQWGFDDGGVISTEEGSYSLGKKEIYYLNSITTATHTALFVKDIRKDGKGIANFKDFDFDRYWNSATLPFGYRYIDAYNNSLNAKTEFYNLYLPTFKTGIDEIYNSTNYANYKFSDWPTSLCRLDEVILFKNEKLNEFLKSNSLTDDNTQNGAPELSKLYKNSALVNDVVSTQLFGFKNVIHLGKNILDRDDIDGITNSIPTVNLVNGTPTNSIILSGSNNIYTDIYDSELISVQLEHNYELAKGAINSFDLDYNHYSARGDYSALNFNWQNYLGHGSTNNQLIYNSIAYDGKLTLKSIETKDYEGNRIDKVGEFL